MIFRNRTAPRPGHFLLAAALLLGSFLIQGCTELGLKDKPSDLYIYANSGLLEAGELRFQVSGTAGMHFISEEQFGNGKHPSLRTPTAGTLVVRFWLQENGGDRILSHGRIDLELKEDWRHTLRFHADSLKARQRHCFGCLEYYAFPLDASGSGQENLSADSVHVIRSGNSISNPVVY